MTPKQVELARHALGLPSKSGVSYRNRFVASAGHPNYADWMAMTKAGAARRRDGAKLIFGGSDLFWLTASGAKQALIAGERLCPEDFPEAHS